MKLNGVTAMLLPIVVYLVGGSGKLKLKKKKKERTHKPTSLYSHAQA